MNETDPVSASDDLRSDEAVFRKMAGKHGDYYLDIRRKMERTENELIWNWSAFALNIGWFLLKRMWGAAIVIAVGYAVFFAVVTQYIMTGILVPSWATAQATLAAIGLLYVALIIGVPLFCGLFGNKLYVTYINARIRDGDPHNKTKKNG